MPVTVSVEVREFVLAHYVEDLSAQRRVRVFRHGGAVVDQWTFARAVAMKFGLPSDHHAYNQCNSVLIARFPLRRSAPRRRTGSPDPHGSSHVPRPRREAA